MARWDFRVGWTYTSGIKTVESQLAQRKWSPLMVPGAILLMSGIMAMAHPPTQVLFNR